MAKAPFLECAFQKPEGPCSPPAVVEGKRFIGRDVAGREEPLWSERNAAAILRGIEIALPDAGVWPAHPALATGPKWLLAANFRRLDAVMSTFLPMRRVSNAPRAR